MKYKSQSATPLTSQDYDLNLKEIENRVYDAEINFAKLKNQVSTVDLTPVFTSINELRLLINAITDGSSLDLDTFKEVSDKLALFQTDLASKSSAQALLDLIAKVNALLPIKSVSGSGATFDANTGELKIVGGGGLSSFGTSTQTTQVLLHFDGANGSSNIVDIYGKTITKVGNPILSNQQSVFGDTSLYLNGSSAIDISGLNGLNSNTHFSIDCFIRLEQLGVTQVVANIYDSVSGGVGWIFSVSSTNKLRFFNSITNTFVDSTITLIANKTYHVAMYRKNNVVSIFVDTEFVGSLPVNATIGSVTNYNFCIGSLSNSRQLWFKGWIDEFRVASYTDVQNFVKPTVAYAS